MQVSDSESEIEMLTTLLRNHNQSDLFQGLSQLTHSRSVLAARAAAVSAKKSALAKKQPTKPGRKRKTAPSEVNAGAFLFYKQSLSSKNQVHVQNSNTSKHNAYSD